MELFFYIPKAIRARESGKRVLSWIAKHPEVQMRSAQYADFIVPVGGDGTMLSAIHEYWKLQKPFFGIHAGHRGFLMNHITSYGAFKGAFKNPRLAESTMLVGSFYTKSGKKHDRMAFNDIFVNAQPGSIVKGSINGDSYPEKQFEGDGIIVATAQGSTAYNANAGGSILPLGHPIMAVTSISSAISPIRDTVTCQPVTITIRSDPVPAHADSQPIQDVTRIQLKPSDVNVILAFAHSFDFEVNRYNLYT